MEFVFVNTWKWFTLGEVFHLSLFGVPIIGLHLIKWGIGVEFFGFDLYIGKKEV